MSSKADIGRALPKGWQKINLGEVCKIRRGGSPRPIQNYLTTEKTGINWLRIRDASLHDKYILETKEKISVEGLNKSLLVNQGDFILSNSMSYGRPYIMKIDACIHDGWLALSNIKKMVDSEYLYYLLLSSSIQNKFVQICAGSGVRNLKKESVALISIFLPSLPEQKAIANMLEKWDTAIEKTEALIAEKEKQFRWFTVHLMNNQSGYLEKLNSHFDEDIIIEKGKPLVKNNAVQGDIPVIAGGKTSPYSHNQYTHHVPCITISGSGAYAGYVRYHNSPIWASDCNVIYSKKYSTEYLYFALKSKQSQIYAFQSGSGQPHVYAKDIQNISIPLPPLTEQKRITHILNTAQKEMDTLKSLAKQYRTQKRGLMQKLLTGIWRVKI